MTNIAIFGSFFGDEAKARAAHILSKSADWCIKPGGGNNAGHTIYHNGKKIIRHLIPSADFSIDNKAFLGAGMVINPKALLEEVLETEEMFPGAANKIYVDPDAFIVTEEHIAEDKEKNKHIGSTGKGITPAYRDKIARIGKKISHLIAENNETINKLKELGVKFEYVLSLRKEFEKSNLVFEGSQSILLDINYGNYPYCTSGDCGLGGILASGFAFAMPDKVYGAMKAYSTRVGNGPFPTELFGETAEKIQNIGKEIGATTKRLRRVGWLDLAALKYAIAKGGLNGLIISKLDVLNGFEKIKVCVGYEGGDLVSGQMLDSAKPIYVELDGWKDASDLKCEKVQNFIELVEKTVNVPIDYISYGVNENEFVKVR